MEFQFRESVVKAYSFDHIGIKLCTGSIFFKVTFWEFITINFSQEYNILKIKASRRYFFNNIKKA